MPGEKPKDGDPVGVALVGGAPVAPLDGAEEKVIPVKDTKTGASGSAQDVEQDTHPSLSEDGTSVDLGSGINVGAGDAATEVQDTQELRDSAARLMGGLGDEDLLPTDEEFRSATEVFSDPSSWELLEKFGNSQESETILSRQSLYVKFDPLVKGARSPGIQQRLKPKKDSKIASIQEFDSDDLILMSTPPCPRTLTGPAHVEVSDGVSRLLNDADKILLGSPLATSSDQGTDGDRRPDLTSKDSSDSDIVQVLKYSQSDVTRMRREWELDTEGRRLKKEKEHSTRMEELQQELNQERKSHQDMKEVLAAYEKTINQLIADRENSSSENQTSLAGAIKERDQAVEDLQSVETAFSDLHRRFEKTKERLEGFKQNEDTLKKCVTDYQAKLKKQEERYQSLKCQAEDKLDLANTDIEKLKKSRDVEIARLTAELKRKDMKLSSMETTIEQKVKENQELVAFCDELIIKVGAGSGS